MLIVKEVAAMEVCDGNLMLTPEGKNTIQSDIIININ